MSPIDDIDDQPQSYIFSYRHESPQWEKSEYRQIRISIKIEKIFSNLALY